MSVGPGMVMKAFGTVLLTATFCVLKPKPHTGRGCTSIPGTVIAPSAATRLHVRVLLATGHGPGSVVPSGRDDDVTRGAACEGPCVVVDGCGACVVVVVTSADVVVVGAAAAVPAEARPAAARLLTPSSPARTAVTGRRR